MAAFAVGCIWLFVFFCVLIITRSVKSQSSRAAIHLGFWSNQVDLLPGAHLSWGKLVFSCLEGQKTWMNCGPHGLGVDTPGAEEHSCHLFDLLPLFVTAFVRCKLFFIKYFILLIFTHSVKYEDPQALGGLASALDVRQHNATGVSRRIHSG